MATTLTFEPGRVPGLGQAAKARPAPIGNMSATQREALAALIHEPIGVRESRPEWANVGPALVWIVCTAVALIWSAAIVFALASEIGWVPQFEALMAGNALDSHAVVAPAAAHTVANQSSATVNRTM
jgi:hypothetical protein